MSVIHLLKANLRKGKGTTASLLLLIAAAALLLNVGLTIIAAMVSFYDYKVEELNDPHVVMVMMKENYKPEYGDFFNSYSGVQTAETESVVVMSLASFRYGGSDMNSDLAVLNADASRQLAPLKLVNKLDTVPDSEAVYLPYSFRKSGDYSLGDTLTITYQDASFSYRIAGFFETTMLGTNNMGVMKLFLADAAYRELSGKAGESPSGILMSATLEDMKHSGAMLEDFHKAFPLSSDGVNAPFHYMADIEVMKQVSGLTTNMVAMILVAFAAVIVLVSLIVIRFRVTSMIEDGIANIGVLKAIGYTSRQIAAACIGQFALVSLLAGIAGVALSYAFFPMFGGIIASLTGLLWVQGLDVVLNLASILFVLVSVAAVALLSSRRIRKLHPVTALRGGLTTHSFKKNFFPFDKAKGGLQLLHACKSMMMNNRQNAMITVIMICVTFASIFSIVLYDNIAREKTAFVHLVGAETSNIAVLSNDEASFDKLRMAIEQMEGVRRTVILDTLSVKVDGQSIYTNISDDFGKLNNQTVYEGRFPKHDNEIAISWATAKLLDKSIGDTVSVEAGGASYAYLVTGLSQLISNMGQAAYLTIPGVRHLIPDYEGQVIRVYLDKVTNEAFMNEVKVQYGHMTADIMDIDSTIESQSSIYSSAVSAVMAIVLIITIMVVVLILYMVIKSTLLKRKRDFGILKATGYTTVQLMNQLALGYIPIMLAGVTIGGVLGSLYTNSVLTLLLSGAGIHNVQFTIKLPYIAALCIGLVALAYAVSMTAAYRMRKITPHGLITE
ncbi:ABC transporter permease [Paenibacillaceae bacterium WGS1546]|uniref:ABC transporter permease n=1 Tax=Cohnella sp. WGS1546 TaxID=3366810 RepID=UPI00372D0BD1